MAPSVRDAAGGGSTDSKAAACLSDVDHLWLESLSAYINYCHIGICVQCGCCSKRTPILRKAIKERLSLLYGSPPACILQARREILAALGMPVKPAEHRAKLWMLNPSRECHRRLHSFHPGIDAGIGAIGHRRLQILLALFRNGRRSIERFLRDFPAWRAKNEGRRWL